VPNAPTPLNPTAKTAPATASPARVILLPSRIVAMFRPCFTVLTRYGSFLASS